MMWRLPIGLPIEMLFTGVGPIVSEEPQVALHEVMRDKSPVVVANVFAPNDKAEQGIPATAGEAAGRATGVVVQKPVAQLTQPDVGRAATA
jgi:hypothetical protein